MTEHTTLERGDRFTVHSDPTTDEMVVLDTDHVSGYRAVFVAEQDSLTGEWDGHWLKESFIHDERNLGAASRAGSVDEGRLQRLDRQLRDGDVAGPDGVAAVPSLD